MIAEGKPKRSESRNRHFQRDEELLCLQCGAGTGYYSLVDRTIAMPAHDDHPVILCEACGSGVYIHWLIGDALPLRSNSELLTSDSTSISACEIDCHLCKETTQGILFWAEAGEPGLPDTTLELCWQCFDRFLLMTRNVRIVERKSGDD